MTPAEREAWLANRRKGIGSSDAPAICGYSSWATPHEIYLEKLGKLAPRKTSSAMQSGIELEPLIAKLYEVETKTELTKGKLVSHPSVEWMLSTPDYLSPSRIVECKNVHSLDGWGEPGTDEVPPVYYCQAQHQMLTMQADVCDIPVIVGQNIRWPIGGIPIGIQDFRIYTVELDRDFATRMYFAEEAFWEMVQKRTPPPIDWEHPSTVGMLSRRMSDKNEPVKALSDADSLWGIALHTARAGIKFFEEHEKQALAKLAEIMGDSPAALMAGDWTVERKTISRAGYTCEVKPTTFVTTTVKEPKHVERSNGTSRGRNHRRGIRGESLSDNGPIEG